jgi:hypothetical protein
MQWADLLRCGLVLLCRHAGERILRPSVHEQRAVRTGQCLRSVRCKPHDVYRKAGMWGSLAQQPRDDGNRGGHRARELRGSYRTPDAAGHSRDDEELSDGAHEPHLVHHQRAGDPRPEVVHWRAAARKRQPFKALERASKLCTSAADTCPFALICGPSTFARPRQRLRARSAPDCRERGLPSTKQLHPRARRSAQP